MVSVFRSLEKIFFVKSEAQRSERGKKRKVADGICS